MMQGVPRQSGLLAPGAASSVDPRDTARWPLFKITVNIRSNHSTLEVTVITEMRDPLASYLGHRINVRGVVDEVRVDRQGTRACIKLPELDGEVISSHVWVLGLTEDWLEAKGQQVKFSAVVRDYNNGSGRNYCLRNPSELKTINPPVIRVVTPEGFRGPFFKQNSGPKPRQEARWSHHRHSHPQTRAEAQAAAQAR
jgi:hypothetical protein